MEHRENEFNTIEEAIVYAESKFLNFEIKKKGDYFVVTGEALPKGG